MSPRQDKCVNIHGYGVKHNIDFFYLSHWHSSTICTSIAKTIAYIQPRAKRSCHYIEELPGFSCSQLRVFILEKKNHFYEHKETFAHPLLLRENGICQPHF